MRRWPRYLASVPLLLVAACATGPQQDLRLADMLPTGDQRPSAPADHTLFFDLDSAALTAESIATLDRLVRDPARSSWTRFDVAGHADRSGPERHNRTLSAERADAVRRYLVGAGIPDAIITIAAYGEKQVLVGTADGIVEPQNRRVEIYLRSN